MNTTRIMIIGVSLLVSLGVAVMFSAALNKAPERVTVRESVESINVLVFTRKTVPGDRLKSTDIKWQKWPKEYISQDLITEDKVPDALSKYIGGLVRAEVFEGEPVYDSKVVSASESRGFMSSLLSAGMRAISVEVSSRTGVGGFVLPGDYVDVMVADRIRNRDGNDTIKTNVALSNIRVLAVDQMTTTDNGNVGGKILTLEVAEEEAGLLMALSERSGNGMLIALRSGSDSDKGTRKRVAGNEIMLVRGGFVSAVSAR